MHTYKATYHPRSAIYSEKRGEGEPLILIHGLGGSSRWWARNIDALAKQFQVHVIDLEGCGRSRHRGRFVLHKAAAQVKQWMESHGLRRAHIVGHSMGGFIAAELAADYPEMVDRLVLVDAAIVPPEHSEKPGWPNLFQSLRDLPMSLGPARLSDVLTMGMDNALLAARAMMRSDLRQKLRAIRAPALVVWGQRDAMVPLSVGKALAGCLSPKKLVVINNAGHCPMWDRPDIFNRVVSHFLKNERAPLTV
jgi:pimeloyl-ACP methyl ester carboxylesterase